MRHGSAAGRRGTASTELALLAPFLFYFFVIAVDYARIFYFSLTITSCARNGAVYGAGNPTQANDTAGIQAAAQKDAANLQLNLLQVSSSTDSASSPTQVTVTVTYPFTTLTNVPGLPSSITLTSTIQATVGPLLPN